MRGGCVQHTTRCNARFSPQGVVVEDFVTGHHGIGAVPHAPLMDAVANEQSELTRRVPCMESR